MIERNEFEGWMELLRGDIKGVHDRLDGLNGRTRVSEQKIAVLEDRSQKTSDPTARWTAGLAGAGLMLVELARQFWGGPK